MQSGFSTASAETMFGYIIPVIGKLMHENKPINSVAFISYKKVKKYPTLSTERKWFYERCLKCSKLIPEGVVEKREFITIF